MNDKRSNQIRLAIALILATGLLIVLATWLAVPGYLDWLSAGTATPILPVVSDRPQTIDDLFPLAPGSRREYQTRRVTAGTTQNEMTTGQYSETVVSVDSSLARGVRVIAMRVEGENYWTACAQLDGVAGESESWYVVDETRLFITCSRDSAYAIAEDLARAGDTQLELPDYIAPLEVGARWARFEKADVERADNSYLWYVESTGSVTVPAGTYTGCYRILLQTNPDTTIQQVCPGVGLVSWQYTHHGSVNDYSAELSGFEKP